MQTFDDDFEPLPVPRKRLRVLAVTCFVLMFLCVTPYCRFRNYSDTEMFVDILSNGANDKQLGIVAIFLFAPSVAALLAGIIAWKLSRVPLILLASRVVNWISVLLSAIPILILIAIGILIAMHGLDTPWKFRIALGAIIVGNLTAVLFLFLAPGRPGRGVVGIFSALMINCAIMTFFCLATDGRFLLPLCWIHLLAAITGLILSTQLIFYYRRERKLERAFRARLDGIDYE